ncbi:Oidioi.mRNA.OKI2018_I69.XSR.g15729.t1.cds [Oikopleura dioica]|uniref:Oidioi.mRNA.OKI2018_I69.XSR.g15729.t1.cds n=1 Tax=Oikopleura dioica TaxID=34765 RepID=A0ABN7SK59_OIKDI|nr:Oidioi.mRNA.OKI2018_I69.XSR.g15729.t1.cds [Oikopleura dioica]
MKILLCSLLATSGVVTGWFVEKEITGFANQPVEIPLTWEEEDTEDLSICLYARSTNESSIVCADRTDSKIEVPANTLPAGNHKMILLERSQTASDQLMPVPNENSQDASFSQQFILRLNRNYSLFIVDQSIGWLYFFLWSVSFYPQVIMNFRRKSVVGFGFDYLGYDYVGFAAFSLYNCLLFWSPAVFNLYLDNYPGASNPIQLNDVLFCLHAVLIQTVNLYQCLTYERGGQSLSKVCVSILVLVGVVTTALVIVAHLGLSENIGWFQILLMGSYIKVGSSVIKYIPQVLLNYKRKCTLGYAIDMAILDLSGGTACYLQVIVQSVNANDMTIITGNSGKLGIGLVSVFFDIILLTQHFCLYGKNNEQKLLELEKEVDEEKSPFVSQRLGSFLGSRVGFSPTTSAVLYHGGRGDLLASTASFRDVFNSKMDVQQEEVWANVMESVTGSRPGFGLDSSEGFQRSSK